MDLILNNGIAQQLGLEPSDVNGLLRFIEDPWVVAQFLVIFSVFAVTHLMGSRLEAALETLVRRVTGMPRLLRFAALLLRRTRTILAALLLGASVVAFDAMGASGRTQPVSIAFALVSAWVGISVVTRYLRNRALARLVAWIAWTYVALRTVGVLDAVADSLDSISVTLGATSISIWYALQALLLVGALLWLALFVGEIVERQIGRIEDLSPSLRVLIGKLAQILLLVLASAVALDLLGIDLAALAFFGGALGLGIGFGLQKVVSNFVSGLIILLDRSIKPGDTIAIGETFGWVRSLQARFVSVITRDGREYLIPNEDFVTQRVENWSFTDTLVRIDVVFGTAYGSDPHEVRRLAVESVKGIERVQPNPPPVCHLTAFGDSSLDFILRFWIADPQNGVTNIRGAALLACWDSFKEAGISIPFPHRQILVDQAIPVNIMDRATSAAPHGQP